MRRTVGSDHDVLEELKVLSLHIYKITELIGNNIQEEWNFMVEKPKQVMVYTRGEVEVDKTTEEMS